MASTKNMIKSASGKLYEPDSPQGKMIRSQGGNQSIMVESASGKLYEPDSPQGKMIRSKGGVEELPAEKGVFGQILESLKTQTQLLFGIDDNTEISESEKRNKKVDAENTDRKGMFSKITGGVGAGLKGVGGVLNKVNPFQEGGLGTKMSIALLAGALFAISQFGDKLIKPLSSVLEMIDSEGGLLEKFKDSKFFEDSMIALESWKESLSKLKDDIAVLLESIGKIGTIIQSAFTSVNEYIDSWDSDGVPGLSKEEVKAGMDKLTKDLWDTVVEITPNWIKTLGTAALAYAIGMPLYRVGVAVAGALITKSIVGGGAAAASGVAGPGMIARMAASGTLTKLGLAGLVAGSIIGIYTASKNALIGAVDDETGKIDKTKFSALFLAGDGEGGFGAAIKNAFTGGPTAAGALIGIKLGAAGGPFGMLMGGLAGAAIGGVIGGIAGYLGPDGVDSVIENTVGLFKSAVDDISTFFGAFFAGVESFAKGDGFDYGKKKFLAENVDLSRGDEIEAEKRELEAQLQEQIDNPTAGSARGQNDAIRFIEAKIQKLAREQKNIDEASTILYNDAIKQRTEASAVLPGLYAELATHDPNEFSRRKTGNDYDVTLKKIKKLEAIIAGAESTISSNPNTNFFTLETQGFDAVQPIIKTSASQLNNNGKPRGRAGGGNVVINQGDTSQQNLSTVVANELSTTDNYTSSRLLAMDANYAGI
jgi:hypothetical protein